MVQKRSAETGPSVREDVEQVTFAAKSHAAHIKKSKSLGSCGITAARKVAYLEFSCSRLMHPFLLMLDLSCADTTKVCSGICCSILTNANIFARRSALLASGYSGPAGTLTASPMGAIMCSRSVILWQ